MENFVRTKTAKEVGSNSSSTNKTEFISSKYGNTSIPISIANLSIYVVSLLIRFLGGNRYFVSIPGLCSGNDSAVIETLADNKGTHYILLVTLLPITLSIIAFLFRYWAMSTLGSFFSRRLGIQGKSHRVIQEGPYALVRHPGYAANCLMYLVFALVVTGDALFGGLLWSFYIYVLLWLRIAGEEEMLCSDCNTGEDYKKYMNSVRYRIVPGVI